MADKAASSGLAMHFMILVHRCNKEKGIERLFSEVVPGGGRQVTVSRKVAAGVTAFLSASVV